jgi:hypothetical protein
LYLSIEDALGHWCLCWSSAKEVEESINIILPVSCWSVVCQHSIMLIIRSQEEINFRKYTDTLVQHKGLGAITNISFNLYHPATLHIGLKMYWPLT